MADAPKQIYRCDFPGCDRHFVRADLCARHRERHTAKGSHLQRKDAFLNSQRQSSGHSHPPSPPSAGTTLSHSPTQAAGAPAASQPDEYASATGAVQQPYNSDMYRQDSKPYQTDHNMHNNVPMPVGSAYVYSSTSGQQDSPHMAPINSPSISRSMNYDHGFARPNMDGYHQNQAVPRTTMQPPPLGSSPQTANMHPSTTYAQQPYPSPSFTNQAFRSPTEYSSVPSMAPMSNNLPQLPPFGYPQTYGQMNVQRPGNVLSPTGMSAADQHAFPGSSTSSLTDYNVFQDYSLGYAMPVFGNDGFNRSPPIAMDDTFLNSLFSSNDLSLITNSPPPAEPPPPAQVPYNAQLPKLESDGTSAPVEQPTQSSTLSSWGTTGGKPRLDITIRESAISEKKQRRLAQLVCRWSPILENPGRKPKDEILAGDQNDSAHVLSLQMLKTYITSYWMHIHQQMPVLHRPTFNPETCPDLLLLAMICLGAICLERTHTAELTKNCAELGFFMAYHIRWEVFKDAEFRPTAKLWTFQTMLLLELFEKMFSTRYLHERAHIHHATTLTVMRRGSSLIGRSATELPHRDHDDMTRTPPGPDGSINTSGQNTPDAFWNRWITAEATRRVAFAAFIIDSTHATLFGHSAVMSPHDLRLPLPCDEALWSATSSAEVQRVEASLAANGFKPTTFLDGLKKTLNGQKVRTNIFGRQILMAGLLNVSWHMNQRDLQVQSLGAATTLGNQIKWRSSLTRAFDFWRRDFDESLSKTEDWRQACNLEANEGKTIEHKDNVFESRTCLHSLAHMAMHVDITDCQVFGGADRVLGRVVTDADREVVGKRMREQWAPSARARDAVFYALRFLCEVLIPDEELRSKREHQPHQPTFNYSARDDYLLNRPWVLYFALLIVWSYGYALDGPLIPSNYTLTTRELQLFDMQRYLIRMGGVATPDDLVALQNRNSCLGLLLLIRESFQQPRWELLADANEVLGSCVDLLLPGHQEALGVKPPPPPQQASNGV
nr:zinc finger protein klf1 [Quercus suber]